MSGWAGLGRWSTGVIEIIYDWMVYAGLGVSILIFFPTFRSTWFRYPGGLQAVALS